MHSGGSQKLEFLYDYLGRRIEKKVFTTSGATTLTQHVKYVYDGWNLIAEVDGAAPDTVLRTFTWGLDASETLGGAGGVGGLLRMEEGGVGYHAVYDPSHNVTGLVRETAGQATLVASYAYGPFGEKLAADTALGGFIDRNPFRYSTKYTDAETGLVYYGHRYYEPRTGRFLGRDPLGEAGGSNLYGFVRNNPVNSWDYLGMDPMRPVNQEDDFLTDEEGRPTLVMKPFLVEVPRMSDPDDGLGSAWWPAPGDRGGISTLPALIPNNGLDLRTPQQRAADESYAREVEIGRGSAGQSAFGSMRPGVVRLAPFVVTASRVASVALFVGAIFVEPLDWALTAREIYNQPGSPWSYAGLIPLVPAAVGRLGHAAERTVGKTVLGRYPEYTKLAGELGARRFNIPTNVWNKMTEAERWAANQKFLDRMIARGDDIVLATPLDKVKLGSYFQRELDYLFENGYRVSPDGTRLIPGGG